MGARRPSRFSPSIGTRGGPAGRCGSTRRLDSADRRSAARGDLWQWPVGPTAPPTEIWLERRERRQMSAKSFPVRRKDSLVRRNCLPVRSIRVPCSSTRNGGGFGVPGPCRMASAPRLSHGGAGSVGRSRGAPPAGRRESLTISSKAPAMLVGIVGQKPQPVLPLFTSRQESSIRPTAKSCSAESR